ncbi:two pore domain potassium channel family protein [Erythrobacteraceae bacterium CFH 75059]|nr:two pore domain potassium channel family protein [Erythrobacteraceae bacterium CFH 75059]
MTRAILSRASHLWVTLFITGLFLILSATLMFWIEGDGQPEAFGSIPRAMWWAAVTMTTVGYGDVVPLTAIGKLFGGLISISGIALIAIPTGILASAFSDEMSKF